jgi:hypothetical protein
LLSRKGLYLKIERNEILEKAITEKVQKRWEETNEERIGIHLSDLISPRKAYFKKTDPKPPDIKEILYFVSGLGIEKELTNLLGERHVRTRERSGIYYSPDLFNDFGGDYGILLAEVKSRRRNLADPEKIMEDYDYYLQQLSGYLALEHKNKGALIVLSLAEKVDDSHRTEPVLATYLVEYTKPELKQRRKELTKVRDLLDTAIRTKAPGDFDDLPKCPSWMCGREIKTMVKPPICKTCKPTGEVHGVYREFANDWLAKKHKEGKKTSDHDVEWAEFVYTFEPLCKYYTPCMGI